MVRKNTLCSFNTPLAAGFQATSIHNVSNCVKAKASFFGPETTHPAHGGVWGYCKGLDQEAKFFATKSQLTRFQNASMYFGRALR